MHVDVYSFAWFVFAAMTLANTGLSFFLLWVGFNEHEPVPGIAGVIYFFLGMVGLMALAGVVK